jgi:hypothetical protein
MQAHLPLFHENHALISEIRASHHVTANQYPPSTIIKKINHKMRLTTDRLRF